MTTLFNTFLFLSLAQTTLPVDPDGFMPLQFDYWFWKVVGYAGIVCFQSRWLVQWLYSEKHKESKIPELFWWQSLAGTMLCLAYALRQQDSVFIVGYAGSAFPCVRNLMLIYRKKRETAAGATTTTEVKE